MYKNKIEIRLDSKHTTTGLFELLMDSISLVVFFIF